MILRVLALAAAAAGASAFHPAHAAAPAGDCAAGLCLRVTLGTDTGEGACGTATTLDVTAGDPVDVCYTVTNGSADTLNYHWLGDDVDGAFLTAVEQPLAPGASYQYNRVFAAYRSEAPTATWTATTEQTHYAHDDGGASAFVDVAATGVSLGNPNQNSWEAPLTLPFAVRFYDVVSDRICVSANGLIFFGVTTCPTQAFAPPGVYWFENGPLPGDLPAPVIAPYWMHFYFGGQVHYQTLGDAPNRRFVVEWSNEQAWDADGDGGTGDPIVAFEVVFDEASPALAFEYAHTAFGDPASDDGAAATVGLQRDPAYADQYSYATASLHDGESIVWTPSNPTRYEASAQVHLNVGAPAIEVAPAALDASAEAGASTTQPLAIANRGDRDLRWSLDKAAVAADAHFPAAPRAFGHGDPRGKSAWSAPRSAAGTPRRASAAAPTPPSGAGPSAYAVAGTPDGIAFVGLDLTQPDVLNPILDGEDSSLTSATFVGNDFGKQYAVEVTRSGPLHFYTSTYGTIDTATGAFTPITALAVPSITYIAALRWDPASGSIYAIGITSTQADGSNPTDALYSIDVGSGAITAIGRIEGDGVNEHPLLVNLAISPAGLLYAIDIVDDVLLAIDKTGARATVIGPTGLDANYVQGMDFDQGTGTLYWAAYGDFGSRVYAVDVDSGHLNLLGEVQDDDELVALGIAEPNPCLDAADVAWLAFDAASGTTPGGATSTVTLTFDAAGLDPGTYAANVCVYSNDANHGVASVPVAFTVSAAVADRIFVDGFDAR
ncbi:MAG TPA: hypothetical protein VGC30_00910 [Dokdonella sp.]